MTLLARERHILVILVAALLVWSGIAPKNPFTWFLEVAPVLKSLQLSGHSSA